MFRRRFETALAILQSLGSSDCAVSTHNARFQALELFHNTIAPCALASLFFMVFCAFRAGTAAQPLLPFGSRPARPSCDCVAPCAAGQGSTQEM